MKSSILIVAAGFIALTIGCAQEDMTTTDTSSDATTAEPANDADMPTGGSMSPDVPMTYADGVAGATPPGAADSSSPQTVTAAKVAQETREALQTSGDFIAQNKDEFVNEVQAELNDVNAKLDQMQEQADTLSADARAEWDEQWQAISEKRDALDAKLDELADSTGDAWEELREGTQRAWDEFELAIENATDQFGDSTDQPESVTDVSGDTPSSN